MTQILDYGKAPRLSAKLKYYGKRIGLALGIMGAVWYGGSMVAARTTYQYGQSNFEDVVMKAVKTKNRLGAKCGPITELYADRYVKLPDGKMAVRSTMYGRSPGPEERVARLEASYRRNLFQFFGDMYKSYQAHKETVAMLDKEATASLK